MPRRRRTRWRTFTCGRSPSSSRCRPSSAISLRASEARRGEQLEQQPMPRVHELDDELHRARSGTARGRPRPPRSAARCGRATSVAGLCRISPSRRAVASAARSGAVSRTRCRELGCVVRARALPSPVRASLLAIAQPADEPRDCARRDLRQPQARREVPQRVCVEQPAVLVARLLAEAAAAACPGSARSTRAAYSCKRDARALLELAATDVGVARRLRAARLLERAAGLPALLAVTR